MSPATKVVSLLAGIELILLSLGVYFPNLSLAKAIVFLGLIYLISVAYNTLERKWLVFFVVAAVLLNPFFIIFKFSFSVWRVIDILVLAGIILFYYFFRDSYRKGKNFENYICSFFPEAEGWIVEDRTKDWSAKIKRMVESDRNPDLTLRNDNNKKRVAIECKFRTRPWVNYGVTGFGWSQVQAKNYIEYGRKENVSVYVALGLGGNPKNPKQIFVVPIERLSKFKNIIPLQALWDFKKDPNQLSGSF